MVEVDILVLKLLVSPFSAERHSIIDRDRLLLDKATLILVILHQAQVKACQVSDCFYFFTVWILCKSVVSIRLAILHLQEVSISAWHLDLVIHLKLIRKVDDARKIALRLFYLRPFTLIHTEFFHALPEHEILLLVMLH